MTMLRESGGHVECPKSGEDERTQWRAGVMKTPLGAVDEQE